MTEPTNPGVQDPQPEPTDPTPPTQPHPKSQTHPGGTTPPFEQPTPVLPPEEDGIDVGDDGSRTFTDVPWPGY